MAAMTIPQQIITIAMCVIATVLTRFLPFLIFSSKRPTPPFIRYLGQALPCAVFGMLVIYCLKDVDPAGSSHGIPEAQAILATILLHKWKRQMLLSHAEMIAYLQS